MQYRQLNDHGVLQLEGRLYARSAPSAPRAAAKPSDALDQRGIENTSRLRTVDVNPFTCSVSVRIQIHFFDLFPGLVPAAPSPVLSDEEIARNTATQPEQREWCWKGVVPLMLER